MNPTTAGPTDDETRATLDYLDSPEGLDAWWWTMVFYPEWIESEDRGDLDHGYAASVRQER